jgi:hypothetical protein
VYLAIPGTTILAAQHNTPLEDIANEFNQPYPIAYGGTFGDTAVSGADNLSTNETVASAAPDLANATGVNVTITGTTTITSFGSTAVAGAKRWVMFSDILILTHNATSLILPGGANITTAAGDTALFENEGGGNWRCLFYTRAGIAFPTGPGTYALAGDVPAGAATTIETFRNLIVNGDMQDSQENVDAAGTTTGYYGADQFATYFVTSAGVITTQRVASRTPAGGNYRYRVTITTPDATLAAGEYLTVTQNLEGSNVAQFLYGTASAQAGVVRFGFKGPAGTYAARVGNSAANRSFVALFTITAPQANTDTVQTIAITGDTTGTWLTADGVIGITLEIVLAAGTTFQGTTGWQSGLILGTSAISNGMATGAAVFELFDVGLKLDPDATGVYGAYEVGYTDAVYRPERYFVRLTTHNVGYTLNANALNNGSYYPRVSTAKALTVLSGTYFSNVGSAGTVAIRAASSGFGNSLDSILFYNSADNWTPTASVTISAALSARLS